MGERLAGAFAIVAVILSASAAHSACTVTYSFTGGTTAIATQLNQNFSDVVGCALAAAGGTLTGGTLSGTTTLPGSGAITSAGYLGIGITSPTALLDIRGTYSTANSSLERFNATLNSSATTSQYGILNSPTFSPSGSLSNIYGLYSNPQMPAGAPGITTFVAVSAFPETLTGYTATVANAYGFYSSPVIAAGNAPFTNFSAYYAAAHSNGDGITSGTVTNYGFRAASQSAAAASGGTINNYAGLFNVPTGSGAGTTRNYGLRITGAGGSGGAGATANWSLYDDSTAKVYFAASVGVGTTTPATALDVTGVVNASGGYTQVSDRRYKKDIEPVEVNALDLVSRLKPVSFLWKAPADEGMWGRQIGFVAQDVREVVPEAVVAANNPAQTLGIKYDALIPVLTKAIQQQQAEIADLTTVVRQLRAANDNLQMRVNEMTRGAEGTKPERRIDR